MTKNRKRLEGVLRAAPLAAVLLTATTLLGACQSHTATGSTPGTPASFQSVEPATEAEEARFMQSMDDMQEMAPAIMAANTFGGLDPTGMSRMAVDAAVQQRAAAMQKDLPAMMALNLKRAEAWCASNPKIPECQELREMKAKAQAAR